MKRQDSREGDDSERVLGPDAAVAVFDRVAQGGEDGGLKPAPSLQASWPRGSEPNDHPRERTRLATLFLGQPMSFGQNPPVSAVANDVMLSASILQADGPSPADLTDREAATVAGSRMDDTLRRGDVQPAIATVEPVRPSIKMRQTPDASGACDRALRLVEQEIASLFGSSAAQRPGPAFVSDLALGTTAAPGVDQAVSPTADRSNIAHMSSSRISGTPSSEVVREAIRAEVPSPPPVIAPPVPACTPSAPNEAQPSTGGRGEDGGGGSGGGGGGGGGGGSAAPLQKRWRDQEFRDVLGKGLSACRRNLVTVGIFSFWVNLLVLAVPIYLFQISDRVLTSRSMDTLVMLSAIVVAAIVAHVVVDMMRRMILMRIAVEAESKLGAPVLSAAAKASQNGSSREFQTLADLQQLRNFITGPVLLTMLDAPVAPVYVLVIFLIHPHLGFIVAGTGAALLVVALINQRITAVPFGVANAYSTRANLQAEAMSRNAQVMNAMGMIPEGVAVWGRETCESLKAQVLAQDRNVLMSAVSKFIRLSTQILLLGWGAWLALDGKLTGGMIIAASIVGSRALAPIEGTIEGWRSYVQARSAYARIKALLQSSPLNLERLRLPRPSGRLHVERVLYVPPPNKKVILNGVTFELAAGESLAIVGSSGTGKSTLARMLVGSITPTAGNVRLDSMDLRNWDPRQFGESVGYLPQDVQLFPASIKANIARMREDASDEAVFDAAEIADVHELISQFAQGYETFVGMDGSPLSGGQRQRIGLARAFFGDPKLVVLDEPNSNLDAAGDRALARALVRAKERAITVVAITQRPSLLQNVDKIMILKNGAVQAIGEREQILPMLSGKPGGGRPQPGTDGLPLLET